MKKGLITIFFICAAKMTVAAGNITGKVIDAATGKGISFATVTLMTTDSTLVDGTITDESGVYEMVVSQYFNNSASQNFFMSVSFVGYKTETRILNGVHMDFILREETEQLCEVEVKAKRPLVERQMDKLVMNVAASAFAIGSNGVDIMKKAPGVRIDKDGNITVNGKSVEIYIDGRPSYMSGEQVKGLLQGTAGSQIEKIEIITNPSAKYDASGQGGIINIKLKKNMTKGFNGMLAANYGGMYFKTPNRYYQNDYVTVNLNYRTAKTYTSASLTQVYANQGVEFNSISRQAVASDTMERRSDLRYDIRFQYYNARITNDWYVDEKNTIGVILNMPFMVNNSDANPVGEQSSYIKLGDTYLQRTYSKGRQRTYAPQHTANINYTHTFADSCAQELTVNVDYNRYNSKTLNCQHNQDIEAAEGWGSLPGLDITTHQVVNIYSAKMDFQTMFLQKGFVECGARWALSQTDNHMTTDSIFGNETHTIPTAFNYSEHVAALYATVSWNWAKVSLKGGLRGEYTYSVGDWKDASLEPYRNSRFDLFPTAFVGYNPTDKWRMSASYTRRIKRPNYWQLNPFRNYVDAHSYQEGNPQLQPEFNNQVDVTFGWSQYISLAFNFAHTQEMMHMKGEVLPNGDMCARWINFGTCTTHGGSLSLTEIPIVPKKGEDGKVNGAWLALTVYAGYYNFINKSKDGNYRQQTHYGNVTGTLTAYLPEDIQMAVDGGWGAPMTIGYQHSSGYYDMGVAFKKTFPKQQLTLSLNVRDLLRSTHFTQTDTGLAEGCFSQINQTVYAQSISIGVTWMFGQQQWGKYRRVGQNDEDSRLGGGGGVGK